MRFKPSCHRWLCEVQAASDGFVNCRVRHSIRCQDTKIVMIPAEEFFPRVHKAFGVVAAFWMYQDSAGLNERDFTPIPRDVQRECSWILGLDTSDKGAFFLRAMLAGVLGHYSTCKTSIDEIRRTVFSQLREIPVFDIVVKLTPDPLFPDSPSE